MKILFISSSLGSGGAERVLSVLANYFVEKLGYEVTIATYNVAVEDFYTLNEKIKRIHFGVKNGNNIFTKTAKRIRRSWKIRRIVANTKPDIIIPLLVHTNIEVILATLGNKTPVLVVEHSNYWAETSIIYKTVRIIAYKLANKVILLTKVDKQKYDEYLSHSEVISNPIFLESKEEYVGERERTLLAVGRLHDVKQFDHIIFVFSQIVKKHPEWKLIIAGSGSELDSLTEYANHLGIEENVTFTGNVIDISKLYKKHGVFVLCSSYEGFPMALGEAMFFGMPVVSYDCLTGPSEMIEDQVSGLLVEHNNKIELESAILSLINSKEKRVSLGNSAQKRMEDFSLSKIGKKWKVLIENTVNESKGN